MTPTAFYKSPNRDFTLVEGDTLAVLPAFGFEFDMIFADPPYFLSNGGISVHAGRQVCVDKGPWDKSPGRAAERAFTRAWLAAAREKLSPNGTIWISGTFHNIFIVAQLLEELGFRLLNAVTWEKTNPPPNLSRRVLTHATEILLWARKFPKIPHRYNYETLRAIAGGKQMRDLWRLPAIAPWEKTNGAKHPTQKPLSLLTRILLSCTKPNDWILDPFCGSATTGIAANLLGRRFLGIDADPGFLRLAQTRRAAIDAPLARQTLRRRIQGFQSPSQLETILEQENPSPSNRLAEPGLGLPF